MWRNYLNKEEKKGPQWISVTFTWKRWKTASQPLYAWLLLSAHIKLILRRETNTLPGNSTRLVNIFVCVCIYTNNDFQCASRRLVATSLMVKIPLICIKLKNTSSIDWKDTKTQRHTTNISPPPQFFLIGSCCYCVSIQVGRNSSHNCIFNKKQCVEWFTLSPTQVSLPTVNDFRRQLSSKMWTFAGFI